MNEEQLDFFERLLRVEQEAIRLAQELPPGSMRARAEHIATVLGLLKARLDVFGPVILPAKKDSEKR